MLFAKKFQMFDHDYHNKNVTESTSKNFQKYGSLEPPCYDLSKIQNFNIVLVCGTSDKLCQPGDYYNLKNLLDT